MIRIRKAERADIEALNATFTSSWGRTHGDDIADQCSGLISFFVAWDGVCPVGHAFVNWEGARQKEPARAFPGVPEINRLAVLEDHRRRGIAKLLIESCEKEALDRGFKMLGIGTDPYLPEQENLYVRLGYRDSKVGIFHDIYLTAKDGREVREDTQFLVREIGGQS